MANQNKRIDDRQSFKRARHRQKKKMTFNQNLDRKSLRVAITELTVLVTCVNPLTQPPSLGTLKFCVLFC